MSGLLLRRSARALLAAPRQFRAGLVKPPCDVLSESCHRAGRAPRLRQATSACFERSTRALNETVARLRSPEVAS